MQPWKERRKTIHEKTRRDTKKGKNLYFVSVLSVPLW